MDSTTKKEQEGARLIHLLCRLNEVPKKGDLRIRPVDNSTTTRKHICHNSFRPRASSLGSSDEDVPFLELVRSRSSATKVDGLQISNWNPSNGWLGRQASIENKPRRKSEGAISRPSKDILESMAPSVSKELVYRHSAEDEQVVPDCRTPIVEHSLSNVELEAVDHLMRHRERNLRLAASFIAEYARTASTEAEKLSVATVLQELNRTVENTLQGRPTVLKSEKPGASTCVPTLQEMEAIQDTRQQETKDTVDDTLVAGVPKESSERELAAASEKLENEPTVVDITAFLQQDQKYRQPSVDGSVPSNAEARSSFGKRESVLDLVEFIEPSPRDSTATKAPSPKLTLARSKSVPYNDSAVVSSVASREESAGKNTGSSSGVSTAAPLSQASAVSAKRTRTGSAFVTEKRLEPTQKLRLSQQQQEMSSLFPDTWNPYLSENVNASIHTVSSQSASVRVSRSRDSELFSLLDFMAASPWSTSSEMFLDLVVQRVVLSPSLLRSLSKDSAVFVTSFIQCKSQASSAGNAPAASSRLRANTQPLNPHKDTLYWFEDATFVVEDPKTELVVQLKSKHGSSEKLHAETRINLAELENAGIQSVHLTLSPVSYDTSAPAKRHSGSKSKIIANSTNPPSSPPTPSVTFATPNNSCKSRPNSNPSSAPTSPKLLRKGEIESRSSSSGNGPLCSSSGAVSGSNSKENASGSVYLMLHYNAEKSILEELGMPSRALPRRLNTGDIILFDTDKLLNYGTKLLTRSRWDHVGMVMILCNTLMLLEATSAGGVGLYTLDQRLESYLDSCTLGTRRLVALRDRSRYKKLYSFVHQVKGKPYEKNIFELLKAVVYNPISGGGSHVGSSSKKSEPQMKAMFCSQLIAYAFQSMELMDASMLATGFAPGDFAKDVKLKDASFGKLLEFSKWSLSSSTSSSSKRKKTKGDGMKSM